MNTGIPKKCSSDHHLQRIFESTALSNDKKNKTCPSPASKEAISTQKSCCVAARTTQLKTEPVKQWCSNCYSNTFTSPPVRRSSTQAMERGPELASRNHHDPDLSRPEVRAEQRCCPKQQASCFGVSRSQSGSVSPIVDVADLPRLGGAFYCRQPTVNSPSTPY